MSEIDLICSVTFAGFPLYFSMNLCGLHCFLEIHITVCCSWKNDADLFSRM